MKKSLLQTVSGGADNTAHFQVGTYTGGGGTDVSVSTLGFKPDLMVIRNLSSSQTWSYWVNGEGRATAADGETTITAEYYDPEYAYWRDKSSYLTYNSNGFTVSTNSGASDIFNKSGDEFLYYAWYLDGTGGHSSASDAAGVFVVKAAGSYTLRPVGLTSVVYNHSFSYNKWDFKDGGQQDQFQLSNYWQNATQSWAANHGSYTIMSQGGDTGYIGSGNVDGVIKRDYYNGGGAGSSNEITVGFSPRVLMVCLDPGATTYPFAGKCLWWSTALDSNTVKYTRYKTAQYNSPFAGKETSTDSGYGVTFTATGFYFDSASEIQTNASGSRYTFWAIG
jgi:hypothetical protein